MIRWTPSRTPGTAGRLVAALSRVPLARVGWWMLPAVVACGATPESGASHPVEAPPSLPAATTEPERLTIEVVATYPHDPAAYTQGLLWYGGDLYESTGRYGESTVRRVELSTGAVRQSSDLPPELFGEGLARIDDRLVQLTWQAGRALQWDLETLSPTGDDRYDGEGWGLCFDGRRLIMSDGSSWLQFRDPDSFALAGRIEVKMGDGAVGRLNELECVADRVYANVYTTEWIVRLDPETGRVEALIDASGLLSPVERDGTDVLNGIAYDPDRQLFLVTGKLWPKLFAVRFVPGPG